MASFSQGDLPEPFKLPRHDDRKLPPPDRPKPHAPPTFQHRGHRLAGLRNGCCPAYRKLRGVRTELRHHAPPRRTPLSGRESILRGEYPDRRLGHLLLWLRPRHAALDTGRGAGDPLRHPQHGTDGAIRRPTVSRAKHHHRRPFDVRTVCFRPARGRPDACARGTQQGGHHAVCCGKILPGRKSAGEDPAFPLPKRRTELRSNGRAGRDAEKFADTVRLFHLVGYAAQVAGQLLVSA